MISDIDIHIDRDKCIACGECVDRCIMDNLRLSIAPCRQECPLNMNCQGYIKLIAQGKLDEAKQEIKEFLPFASILGRVCHAPCEDVCERSDIDGAVHIRALKRYLADNNINSSDMVQAIAPETGKKVVVIGSGPAGLMAAWEIRKKGHSVTVIEAEKKPGGLLKYGIPGSRLPDSELEQCIQAIKNTGVVFKTSHKLGQEIQFDQLTSQYDAIVIAIGAGNAAFLDIPGVEHCLDGLSVLNKVNSGEKLTAGDHVAIIGGGNTAVDVALIYKRMGVPDVKVIYRKSLRELKAFKREIKEAIEEGVVFENSLAPEAVSMLADGRFEVELLRSVLKFNSEGELVHGFEKEECRKMIVDQVVLALGQTFSTQLFPDNLINSQTGLLDIEPKTLQSTVLEKLFVCGDIIADSKSVVQAFASGKESAESLNRFLDGESLVWGRDKWQQNGWEKEFVAGPNRLEGIKRSALKTIAPKERSIDTEMEVTLSDEEARQQAARCMSCGRSYDLNKTCWYCLPCEIECPTKALTVNIPYLVK